VRLAHQLAIENEMITAEAVEATEFPEMSQQFMVRSVPKIVINDDASFEGALPEGMFLDQVFEAVGG
jgi:hypothetical protein